MGCLGNDVTIWPPPFQIELAGDKLQTMALLDRIAADRGWKRPYTRVIRDGEPIPIDGVLKRSHSDCGSQVLLPEQSASDAPKWKRRKRTLELAACRNWNSLRERTTSARQSWMCQEYVPSLLTLGEWRFFVVGEHIVSVVHTIKCMDSGEWIGQPVTGFYTMSEIRYVGCHSTMIRRPTGHFRELWARFKRGEIVITDEMIVNPSPEDHSLRVQGTAEVYDFVGTIVRELVVKERDVHEMYNSMSVFCRVDIGLMFDEAGEPGYFVNEIERSATTSLWLRTMEEEDQRTIADSFAGVLHSYLGLADCL